MEPPLFDLHDPIGVKLITCTLTLEGALWNYSHMKLSAITSVQSSLEETTVQCLSTGI